MKSLSLDYSVIENFDNFLYEKHEDLYPIFRSENGKFEWNRYSTLQVRLREVVSYCNSNRMSLKENPEENTYIFSEWIVYLCQISDYIDSLYKLFGSNMKNNYEESIIVENNHCSEERKIINDIFYLEYIRSLAVVHPTETDRHVKRGIQEEVQSCMYISAPTERNFLMFCNGDNIIRKPDRFPIEECFYLRVSPLEIKNYKEAEEFIFDEFQEMIDHNRIDNSELESMIDTEAVGLDMYILLHPKELAEFGAALMKYVKELELIIDTFIKSKNR